MKESISVIIPAYNEETRILPTLQRLLDYLNERFEEFEIIVVDDGSSDRTADITDQLRREKSTIDLISYMPNKGKGHAIKRGVLASKHSLLLTCDADMSTPIEEIEKLIPYIKNNYDIAIGSRALQGSDIVIRQPWYREGMGKTFNLFVRTLVMGGIKDTQCGFKLFKGEVARELFAKSLIKGFSFDVEILFLARKSGYKIKEVPVKWLNSPNSKVRLITDPIKMLLELLKIRINWLTDEYNAKQ